MGQAFLEHEGLGTLPVIPHEGVPPCVISHLLVQGRWTSGDMLLWKGFLYLHGEV